MKFLDALKVHSGAEERRIELYQGDLTALTEEEAVDVLVVSAFPDDYLPTETSLIGALHRKGVSVEELAKTKAVDLRHAFSCWLSQEIVSSDPGIQFKRILCFEPEYRGKPPEVVGDVFRALAPFLGGFPPVRTVAMPVLAAGDQGVPVSAMLPPLIDAAVHWMALGLPLQCLKIVVHFDSQVVKTQELFAHLKEKYVGSREGAPRSHRYDVFISYAHEDGNAVSLLISELQRLRPDVGIFLDRKDLNTGVAWQSEIFEALLRIT